MTSILDKSDVDVSEKARLYNQALLRYNDMAKDRAAKPTSVIVVKENEPIVATDVIADVVTTLPKTLQEKGSQLVSRLKTTKWNDRGELLHEGVAIPGSIVVDLVHDLLRKRKTSDPIGWQQFASQMHAANIPMELVGNVARRQHLQKRTRIPTPTSKPKKKQKEDRYNCQTIGNLAKATASSHRLSYISFYRVTKTGQKPQHAEFTNFINEHCLQWSPNDRILHSHISTVCGQYCVAFLMFCCRNISMHAFARLFTSDLIANECRMFDWPGALNKK